MIADDEPCPHAGGTPASPGEGGGGRWANDSAGPGGAEDGGVAKRVAPGGLNGTGGRSGAGGLNGGGATTGEAPGGGPGCAGGCEGVHASGGGATRCTSGGGAHALGAAGGAAPSLGSFGAGSSSIGAIMSAFSDDVARIPARRGTVFDPNQPPQPGTHLHLPPPPAMAGAGVGAIDVRPVKPWFRRSLPLRVAALVAIVAADAGAVAYTLDQPLFDGIPATEDGGPIATAPDIPATPQWTEVAPAPPATGLTQTGNQNGVSFTVTVPDTWTPSTSPNRWVWFTDPESDLYYFEVTATPLSRPSTLWETIARFTTDAAHVQCPDGAEVAFEDSEPETYFTSDGDAVTQRTRRWTTVGEIDGVGVAISATYTAPPAIFDTSVVLIRPFGESIRPG